MRITIPNFIRIAKRGLIFGKVMLFAFYLFRGNVPNLKREEMHNLGLKGEATGTWANGCSDL
jgi:hypothetical protein